MTSVGDKVRVKCDDGWFNGAVVEHDRDDNCYRVEFEKIEGKEDVDDEWVTEEEAVLCVQRYQKQVAAPAEKKRKREEAAAAASAAKAAKKPKPGSQAERERMVEFYKAELQSEFETLVTDRLATYRAEVLAAHDKLAKDLWTDLDRHLRNIQWDAMRRQNKRTAGVRVGTLPRLS